jgi:hypothetical protein
MAADVDGRVGSDDPVPMLEVRRSPCKIRVIGENFDMCLKMTTPEDFEVVERILAREKEQILRDEMKAVEICQRILASKNA